MRRVRVLIATMLFWSTVIWSPAGALAKSSPSILDVATGDGHTAYDVSGDRERGSTTRVPAQGSPQSVAQSGSTGGGEKPEYYLALLDGPDGPCIGWTTDPAQAISMTSAGTILSLYEQCPAGEGETVPPSVLAQVEVLRFWRTKPVPVMELEIDPGWAITGLRAFLETGAESVPATVLSVPTPVGTAQLDITANYVVDWGDGSAIESYAHMGGPWPDGRISHVFTDAEDVTVAATQVWSGTWRVTDGAAAGASGVLPELPVDASLDLPVEQVQAVIH